MRPIREKAAPRGRPKLSAAEQKAAEKRAKDDGERLSAALRQFGLSQAEAAARSGLRQGWISEMVSGKRAIAREDLRRLGSIGIPPDYLLGLTDTLTPVGMTRTKAHLAIDLARHVEGELAAPNMYPPSSLGAAEPYEWFVDGAKALQAAVDALVPEAELEMRSVREMSRLQSETTRRAGALLVVAKDLMKHEPTDKKVLAALDQVLELHQSLLVGAIDQSTALLGRKGRRLILAPSQFFDNDAGANQ